MHSNQLMLPNNTHTHMNTHARMQLFYGLLGFCPVLPGWAGTWKVKPGR